MSGSLPDAEDTCCGGSVSTGSRGGRSSVGSGVASVSLSIEISVLLEGVEEGRGGAVVAGISMAIIVIIILVGLKDELAVVTGISESILIIVLLVGVADGETVVGIITDSVVVEIISCTSVARSLTGAETVVVGVVLAKEISVDAEVSINDLEDETLSNISGKNAIRAVNDTSGEAEASLVGKLLDVVEGAKVVTEAVSDEGGDGATRDVDHTNGGVGSVGHKERFDSTSDGIAIANGGELKGSVKTGSCERTINKILLAGASSIHSNGISGVGDGETLDYVSLDKVESV